MRMAMEGGHGKGGNALDADVKVTKCVTIHNFECEDPSECSSSYASPEKWMNCFSVASQTRLALHTMRDWELVDTSHVLLHIDVPNQQPYHLPLLITPAQCIYLVTFDLRYEEKSLSKIHRVMKNVYALSSYVTMDREFPPKVLLVGMHADGVEGESRKVFARELADMLKNMPYNRLIDEPDSDESFWAVDGGDLCLSGTDLLSCKIQGYCSWHGVEVHQWINCHHLLQEKLKDDPCIPYCDLKKEVAALSSNAAGLKFDAFLKFLHNYGFIFYHTAEEGEEADKVVVLQPQYLCTLFATVLELGKSRECPTIADLLSSTAANIKGGAKHKKWFQRICINMGLVFEVAKEVHPEFIFLMGLPAGPNSPPRDSYSVPPLLVTFKASGDKCLLPSHFFAAFVTEFLKAAPIHQQSKPKQRRNRQLVESMEQHYVQVSIGSTRIHVVEREFWIEIGLQQLEVPVNDVTAQKIPDEKKPKMLQSFCKRVKSTVDDSTENVVRRLKLTEDCLDFGFYHACMKEDGIVDDYGEYSWEEYLDSPILQCSCCGMQPTTPLQEIWFEEDIDLTKVNVQTVTTVDDRTIRKLCEVPANDRDRVQSQPTATPDLPPVAISAEEVLDEFRADFIKCVDAEAVVYELKHESVIADGDVRDINASTDKTWQNQFLHDRLRGKCTKEALMTVCDTMISVPGNPNMKKLGEKMKSKLEGSLAASSKC